MPWKVLRVVVEVKVPPTSRATEKDLMFQITENMPRNIALPRDHSKDAHVAPIRVKSWRSWWPVFRITEKRAGRL
jgi:hypothetical protein